MKQRDERKQKKKEEIVIDSAILNKLVDSEGDKNEKGRDSSFSKLVLTKLPRYI